MDLLSIFKEIFGNKKIVYSKSNSAKDLFYYKMNSAEKIILSSVIEELNYTFKNLKKPELVPDINPKFKKSFFIKNDDLVIKYRSDVGFYQVISDREFRVIQQFQYSEIDKFKRALLKKGIMEIGINVELKNRSLLEKQWNDSNFSTSYDSRKYMFEFIVEIINQIDVEFANQLTEEYTTYMNKWFNERHWEYDKETKQFLEIGSI